MCFFHLLLHHLQSILSSAGFGSWKKQISQLYSLGTEIIYFLLPIHWKTTPWIFIRKNPLRDYCVPAYCKWPKQMSLHFEQEMVFLIVNFLERVCFKFIWKRFEWYESVQSYKASALRLVTVCKSLWKRSFLVDVYLVAKGHFTRLFKNDKGLHKHLSRYILALKYSKFVEARSHRIQKSIFTPVFTHWKALSKY